MPPAAAVLTTRQQVTIFVRQPDVNSFSSTVRLRAQGVSTLMPEDSDKMAIRILPG
jgi:hypothetical protein